MKTMAEGCCSRPTTTVRRGITVSNSGLPLFRETRVVPPAFSPVPLLVWMAPVINARNSEDSRGADACNRLCFSKWWQQLLYVAATAGREHLRPFSKCTTVRTLPGASPRSSIPVSLDPGHLRQLHEPHHA
jgi:hypothetical protein